MLTTTMDTPELRERVGGLMATLMGQTAPPPPPPPSHEEIVKGVTAA